LQTPSPRRFLIKQGGSAVKPKSRLGDVFDNEDQDASKSSSSSKQFVETPKFSSRSSRSGHAAKIDNSFAQQTANPIRLHVEVSSVESIDDASQQEQHNENEMILELYEPAQHVHDDSIPPTKRQRIEDPDRTTPRRFIFAPLVPSDLQTSTTTNSVADASSTLGRPVFRLPISVLPEPSEPLPDAFSPHRRRQRFLPGGMAAEVQQWVVEAAQSVGQRRQPTTGAGMLQAIVLESSEYGTSVMTLVRATAGSQTVRLLLAGSGKNQSGANVKQGDVLAIKAPSWNLELEGEQWIVGVDWCILR